MNFTTWGDTVNDISSKKEIYIGIFDYWNSKNIRKHRSLDKNSHYLKSMDKINIDK